MYPCHLHTITAILAMLSLYHFLQAYQQYNYVQEESLLEQVASAT